MDKRIKSYGENYQSVRVRVKFGMGKMLAFFFIFAAVSASVYGVMALCGV